MAQETLLPTPAGGSEDAHWLSAELFVIASLQLILVLVAYRLDRAQGPALISESAVAMFFGVTVRHVASIAQDRLLLLNWLHLY